MKKKYFALFLTLALAAVLSLTACASGEQPAEPTTAPTQEPTPEPAPTPTPEPTPPPEPVIVTTSFGRPDKWSGAVIYELAVTNYVGAMTDVGLTKSFPEGGRVVDGASDNVKEYLFPADGGELSSLGLFIVDADFHTIQIIPTDYEHKRNVVDFYVGEMIDGNVEFVLEQTEVMQQEYLELPLGFSYLPYSRIEMNDSYYSGFRSFLVITLEDALLFEETGVLTGFEGAPSSFTDSLQEVLQYSYRVTEITWPDGEPDPMPTPTPEIVVSWGKPGKDSTTFYSYEYTNSVGSIPGSILTKSFPQGTEMQGQQWWIDSLESWGLIHKDPKDLPAVSVFVTDSGTMNMVFCPVLEGDLGRFTYLYRGALVDGNVEFTLAQEESGSPVELRLPEGFSHILYFLDRPNGSVNWFNSLYFLVLSTSDVNSFLETGVLPGYEDAPFLDHLREELTYAYCVTEAVTE